MNFVLITVWSTRQAPTGAGTLSSCEHVDHLETVFGETAVPIKPEGRMLMLINIIECYLYCKLKI